MLRFAVPVGAVLAVAGALAGLATAAAPERDAGGAKQAALPAHGIIVLECSPVRVLSYPARGGQPVTLATFSSVVCDRSKPVPTPLLAQQFTSDFQRMAVAFDSPYKNGNVHVGYLTTNGKRVDLTPAGKEKSSDDGFSGPPCEGCNIESRPRFQPHSSWLYFMRSKSGNEVLMKVDTAVGVRSRAAARFNRQPGSEYIPYHGGPDGAAFSGDGKVVIPLGIDSSGDTSHETYLLNEHGTLGLGEYDEPGLSSPCELVRTLPQMYAPGIYNVCQAGQLPFGCTVNSWAGPNAVLCGSSERIYAITGVAKPASARAKPLTPDVGRENRDPVGSPDGKQFAFISKVPATDSSPATDEQLWVGSTAGGHLRKLGTVPAGADVIGWR
jgi:hypothetical protein